MLNLNTEAIRKFEEQCARGTQSGIINNPEQIYTGEPRGTKNKAAKLHEVTTATQFATDGTITVSQTETTVTQFETNVQQFAHFVVPAVFDALPQITSNGIAKIVTPALPTVPMQQEKPIEMREFPNRMDTIGVEKTVTLSELFTKLQTPFVTSETMDAYESLTKEQQTNLKDKGMYLLGVTSGTGRSEADIIHRTAGAIDIDDNTDDNTKQVFLKALHGVEVIYHTTRKSRPFSPRYRIILPFSVPVTAKEYPIIMQYLANHLQGYGVHVDESCTRVTQCMFFPTISSDQHIHYGKHIDHVTHYEEETTKHPCGVLDVSEILNRYTPPTKAAPLSQKTQKSVPPRERKGFEGIFNRAYEPHEGIQAFLPNVYEFDEKSGRYLHRNSTSGEAGLIVNPDETIHSLHGCDGFGGKTGSVYQLVLFHMFHGDAHAMQVHFNTDERIRKALEQEHGEGETWKAQLKRTESGMVKRLGNNYKLIVENDQGLNTTIRHNSFSNFFEVSPDAPFDREKAAKKEFRESDATMLKGYLGDTYGTQFYSKEATQDMMDYLRVRNQYDPLKEYMEEAAKAWDGKKRVRRLFIDYLKAEDNKFIEDFTEHFLRGGVARTFNAGCKFDEMIVLIGAQGAGKSTLLSALATNSDYFSDSLTSFSGVEAFEAIQGLFIVEISELAALSKTDNREAKKFISSTNDVYRVKFEKYARPHYRRCIFAGSVNEDDFLTDPTGNRRFLPIMCHNKEEDNHKIFAEFTPEEVQQVWGEAVHLYRKNPVLVLPKDAKDYARTLQGEHTRLPQGIQIFEAWAEEKFVNFVSEKTLYENFLGVKAHNKSNNNDKLVKEVLGYVKYTLKWITVRERVDGTQQRGYRRPNTQKREGDHGNHSHY